MWETIIRAAFHRETGSLWLNVYQGAQLEQRDTLIRKA